MYIHQMEKSTPSEAPVFLDIGQKMHKLRVIMGVATSVV